MCTQKPPYDYSEQLYQRYKDAFNNYINDMVGPVWAGLERKQHTLMFRWRMRVAGVHAILFL
jgi:cullin 1